MTSRNLKRFTALYNLIRMWSVPSAEYYLNCIDTNDYSLITESLLLEMECSLLDVTQEVDTCSL